MSINLLCMTTAMLACLLSTASCQLACQLNQALLIDRETATPRCVTCPDHCQFCYADNDKLMCSSCKGGYFITDDKKCSPCSENCDVCYGSGYDKCISLLPGYVFNSETQKWKTCQKGCASCDSTGLCTKCLPGFKEQQVKTDTGVPVKHHNRQIVECVACQYSNCAICGAIPGFSGEKCLYCAAGYGIDIQSGSNACKPCPANCLSCQSNYNICGYCEESYVTNVNTGGCMKMPVENCANYNSIRSVCESCNPGYWIGLTDKNSCNSCTTVTPLCSSCYSMGTISGTETPNLVCLACAEGYTYDGENKKCKLCSDNCAKCHAEGECISCKQGYFLNAENKCVMNDLQNCDYTMDGQTCYSCKTGTYLDGRSLICMPCDPSCITCDGNKLEQCTTCPIDRISLYEKDSAMSFQLLTFHRKCLKECPNVDHNGKKMARDEFSGECTSSIDSNVPLKMKYSFTRRYRSDNIEAVDLIQDANDYFESFRKYEDDIKIKSQVWARDQPQEANTYSLQCNFNGVIKEHISTDRELYYECICKIGYFGKVCTIDKDLYMATQKFMTKFLEDLKNLRGNIRQREFYSIFIFLNYGPLNFKNRDDMELIFINYLASSHFQTPYMQDFWRCYDSLLSSQYRQLDQIRKNSIESSRDINSLTTQDLIYQRILYLAQYVKSVALNSLNQTQDYNETRSRAFQAMQSTRPGSAFSTHSEKFVIRPTNLLGVNTNTHGVEVSIHESKLADVITPLSIVGWTYSSLLFDGIQKTVKFISHVTVISLFDKTSAEVFQDKTNIKIHFPLRAVPEDSDHDKYVCVRIEHNQNSKPKIETFEAKEIGLYKYSVNSYADCHFKGVSFTDAFFTVGYIGTQTDTARQSLKRSAMDYEDQSESLAIYNNDYVTGKASLTESLIILNIILFGCIFAC